MVTWPSQWIPFRRWVNPWGFEQTPWWNMVKSLEFPTTCLNLKQNYCNSQGMQEWMARPWTAMWCVFACRPPVGVYVAQLGAELKSLLTKVDQEIFGFTGYEMYCTEMLWTFMNIYELLWTYTSPQEFGSFGCMIFQQDIFVQSKYHWGEQFDDLYPDHWTSGCVPENTWVNAPQEEMKMFPSPYLTNPGNPY